MTELNDQQYYLQEEQLATCTVVEFDDQTEGEASKLSEKINEAGLEEHVQEATIALGDNDQATQ